MSAFDPSIYGISPNLCASEAALAVRFLEENESVLGFTPTFWTNRCPKKLRNRQLFLYTLHVAQLTEAQIRDVCRSFFNVPEPKDTNLKVDTIRRAIEVFDEVFSSEEAHTKEELQKALRQKYPFSLNKLLIDLARYGNHKCLIKKGGNTRRPTPKSGVHGRATLQSIPLFEYAKARLQTGGTPRAMPPRDDQAYEE